MAEFRMPSLGADMEDAELVEWEKKPGDAIERGDIIAVVETQKGAIEIEAFESGVLERVLVEVGTRVPVGTSLAIIQASGGVMTDITAPAPPAPTTGSLGSSTVQSVPGAEPRVTARSESHAESVTASPVARRSAREAGVPIENIVGSGPEGAVVLADVEHAIAQRSQQPELVRSNPSKPIDGMRQAIARAMSRSKREIPHYYLAHTIELDALTRHVTAVNASRAPAKRLVLGASFISAVARAARAHPEFNGYWQDDMFVPSDSVHVGMAIRLRGGGLVAPAIHDADKLDEDALMARLRDLIARVREGRFRQGELTDPTLTVSSLGERGVDTLYGVIHPPQVCLIGFGAPHDACRVVDGVPVVRRVVDVTLAADHRASDGHAGARFLASIAQRLEAPADTSSQLQESADANT